jgi:hypothetical protein
LDPETRDEKWGTIPLTALQKPMKVWRVVATWKDWLQNYEVEDWQVNQVEIPTA